ncbi:cobalamin biosynthesis protein [Paracoccus sp. CPCC 101403]|uniref:Cobalamin biosynthesis protein n=2 Tax=Paracoccus broussonetiae TaxID=3075834 RepID=A0ABU3E8V0_9RHOB|nr:cobalamin biosynthesis protein [Paracoccus sp. CPCC 101403]MDT1060645.1 cobalamin biosynthesis protein [Paracoccus sp. CPCC 101403]
MRIAGLGFRNGATLASLREALARAGRADALATCASKAHAPALQALARHLDLPLMAVPVAGVATPTRSSRVEAMHGTGSVAEAAALAALGADARIVVPRVTSRDGMATAAIAEGDAP